MKDLFLMCSLFVFLSVEFEYFIPSSLFDDVCLQVCLKSVWAAITQGVLALKPDFFFTVLKLEVWSSGTTMGWRGDPFQVADYRFLIVSIQREQKDPIHKDIFTT